MWEIPYRTVLIIMLSSRYIPEEKEDKKGNKDYSKNKGNYDDREVSTVELKSLVMSKGGRNKKESTYLKYLRSKMKK